MEVRLWSVQSILTSCPTCGPPARAAHVTDRDLERARDEERWKLGLMTPNSRFPENQNGECELDPAGHKEPVKVKPSHCWNHTLADETEEWEVYPNYNSQCSLLTHQPVENIQTFLVAQLYLVVSTTSNLYLFLPYCDVLGQYPLLRVWQEQHPWSILNGFRAETSLSLHLTILNWFYFFRMLAGCVGSNENTELLDKGAHTLGSGEN